MAEKNLLRLNRNEKDEYLKSTKEALENYSSNLFSTSIEQKRQKNLERLRDLKKDFEDIEAEAYEAICGYKLPSYEAFQKHIQLFFAQHIEFYNDIQKIAVRKSNGEGGINALRNIASKTVKGGVVKISLTSDEIKMALSEIIPIYPDKNIASDVIFSDNFFTENFDWLEILEKNTSIAKRKGKMKEGESPFYKEAIEAMSRCLARMDLSSIIDEEELKKTFWPVYRNFFLIRFCESLERRIEGLEMDGNTISASKEKGKTVLHGGLYQAIIKAKDDAVTVTDNFFYEGQGSSFSMELEGKLLTIFPAKGLFSKMKVNFSSQMMEKIRSTLMAKIDKKLTERENDPNDYTANFSTAETTKEWLRTYFSFQSGETWEAIDAVLNATSKEYFRNTNPSQIIGDLSEVLYSAFFNLLKGQKDFSKPLGGGVKKYGAEELQGLDSATIAWKQGKQPAVDLLLNGKYGIQVKNAFSSKALASHSITFISEKSVNSLFLQEFRDLPDKNILAPATAQAIALNAAGVDISDIWSLLVEIYSYFIDRILDLGLYDANVFAGDKNVFYLYLSQYLIPASQLIQSAIDSLEDNRKISPVKLQGKFEGNKIENLVEQAKMSVDYTFYNSFIQGFDILKQTFEQQQK